ncbi:archease [Halorubrum halophilum]|uniref:archease n=1 Tax=Halorubrum halophilum TaxID=413816 RepID=UPI000678583E|nr:archease [Halorubrum halophilum]
MSYALREHTADIAVEATAPTLAALFEAVADGLTAASCETVPESGERFEFTETAESREALLFDYLDRLVYERDVRLVLPAGHRCAIAGPDGADDSGSSDDDATWTAEASARGVSLDAVAAREIKAVTYSEMALERRDDEWYAYVVFDV